MVKGFNSDISIKGRAFHIQTEDWGRDNPYLVSRVYSNGAVVKTVKTPYAVALKTGPVSDHEALSLALKRQHYQVLDDLMASGS
jgi:hypothetical protein